MTEMTKAELDKLPGSFPPEPHGTEKWEEEYGMLVRDFTSQGFMSKAEAKERLGEIILKNRNDLVESILAEIPDIAPPASTNLILLKQEIRDKYGK